MKIGVLTSSRADYSIYYPLLCTLRAEGMAVEIIAFGTHLSPQYGLTYRAIEADGFAVAHRLDTLPEGDSPYDIARSMARTMEVFAALWRDHTFDIVLALGDRFEMFAAVAAAMPFNVKIAHIAGGETTLGAIDNAFRHAISHMSVLHFASAAPYAERLRGLLGNGGEGVYNTGSLSVENFKKLTLLSREAFGERWQIGADLPFLLITMHPETVSYDKNELYADALIAALSQLSAYRFVITMPNSDTMGKMIRDKWEAFARRCPQVVLVESFGTIGYLSAMQHCAMLLGNTSSGFVEAAMFPKWVINLGNRQTGRILTPNIYACPFETSAILAAIQAISRLGAPPPVTIYGDGQVSQRIVSILKARKSL